MSRRFETTYEGASHDRIGLRFAGELTIRMIPRIADVVLSPVPERMSLGEPLSVEIADWYCEQVGL